MGIGLLRRDPALPGQISRVWKLSIPAILTQITSIVMQYIDSAMVGGLGAGASAAVGLVASSTWLFNGIGIAIATGFSVQVAQYIGADKPGDARRVVKHGLLAAFVISLILMGLGMAISGKLPQWLGAEKVLWKDSAVYFFVYSCSLPFLQMNRLTSAFLQCSGNMVVPSILNAVMCLLDVVFNALLIPRYGVLGAALGTALSVVAVSLFLLWFSCLHWESLRLNRKEPCAVDFSILTRALRIGFPIGLEETVMCAAMVVSTAIIAPLGSVAIAAHSFAITAEALCYMPGYGLGAAATTLVGQSVGACDYKGARRMGGIAVTMGAVMMGCTGLVMYGICPWVFRLLTPVAEVQELAAQVLRIGLIAEPLFGVSIVASGALRGAEDTLVPSILHLLSMWVVRLGLSVILVGPLGLSGVWIAMAVELCIRGLMMLLRQIKSPYLKEKC